jgi:hypothetical protein
MGLDRFPRLHLSTNIWCFLAIVFAGSPVWAADRLPNVVVYAGNR